MINKDIIENYIDFLTDLLALKYVPSIEYDNSIPTVMGYVYTGNLEDSYIKINLSLIKDNKLFFMGLAHEMRHAAQMEAINSSDGYEIMDQKLIDAFKINLDNYISPKREGYKTQPIELDAFGFAEFIMNFAFGITCAYNETFSKEEIDLIKENAKMHSIEYSADEIMDSISYSGFDPKIIFVS